MSEFGFEPSTCKKKCKKECKKEVVCAQGLQGKDGIQGPAGKDATGVYLDLIFKSAEVLGTVVIDNVNAVTLPRGLIRTTDSVSIPGSKNSTFPYFDSIRQGVVLQEAAVYEFIWRLQGAAANIALPAPAVPSVNVAPGASILFVALVNGVEWEVSKQKVTFGAGEAVVVNNLYTFNTTVSFVVPSPFFNYTLTCNATTLVQFAVAASSYAFIQNLFNLTTPVPVLPLARLVTDNGQLISENAMSITVKKIGLVPNCIV